jgi:hypothetical protein
VSVETRFPGDTRISNTLPTSLSRAASTTAADVITAINRADLMETGVSQNLG